jgi:cell division protease FtsH
LAPLSEFQPEVRRYSEATAREIDCAVRELVEAAFEKSSAILRKNQAGLEAGAKKLLEKETLNEDEVKSCALTV